MHFLIRRLCAVSVGLLTLMLSLSAGGQEPGQKPASTIRVTTGEVVVDVNVTDSGGRPVNGLKEADFEVYEDGVRQQISSFRLISGSAAPQTPAAAPGADVRAGAPGLGADTPVYPHLVSFVFDKVNTERADASRAAQAAITYVEKSLGRGDIAAVFGIGFGVHVYQGFTGDRTLLKKAIQDAVFGNTKIPGDVSAEIRATLQSIPSGGAFLPNVYTDDDKIELAYTADFDTMFKFPILAELRTLLVMQRIEQQMRGNRSLAGLLAIIEGQRVMPGRKCLIFLSGGFPLPAITGQFAGGGIELRTITSAANRAGISMYSVDASGLRGQDPEEERAAAARQAINSRVVVGPNTSVGRLAAVVGMNTLETLEQLAEQTGGYTVKNTSDLAAGMERIGSYLSEYYVLTYMPAKYVPDGRFHNVSVKVKRSGSTVQARKGYFALPDTDRFPLTIFEAELLENLNLKSPPANFPVYAAGYSFPGRGNAKIAALFVQFPLARFKFDRLNGPRRYQALADVLLLVKKPDGSIVHRLSRQYELETVQDPAGIRTRSYCFYRRVPLEPGDYVLETVVRDRRAENLSVKRAALRVEQGDPQGVRLSSIILGRDSILTGNDAGENPFRIDDPLLAAGTNLLPDVSAVYRKSEELTVFFTAGAPPDSPQLQSTFEFLRDGKPERTLDQALPAADARGMLHCLTRIGLDQFKPGQYELRVTVKGGKEPATGVVRFRVEQ